MRWNANETETLKKEVPVRAPGKLMAGNFTFYFSIKRKPGPDIGQSISFESVIGNWLNNKGYVQSFRNDLPPASVLIVAGPKTHVVMSANEVIPRQAADRLISPLPEMIPLPQVKLSLDANLPFLPEANPAALIKLGVSSISLQLSGILTDGIPLNRLQAAIKNNPQLKARARANDQNLIIITEVVRASKIRLLLMDKDGNLLGDGVNKSALQTALGSNFESDTPGVGFLREGVNLGFKAAKVSAVATVLGGEVELQLNPIPVRQLLVMISDAAVATRSTTSDFRLFGLIIAQGNYNAKSLRAGGELPGAFASAQMVADKLQQLIPTENGNDLQLLTSRQRGGLYDPGKRITKSELVLRVRQFVQQMRERTAGAKPKAVIFYYFGHGLADGISHSVYLVPESFEDRPEKSVNDLDDLLVSVDWVRDQLLQISDNVILLIDTCRKHAQESEELRRLWGDALIQPAEGISGVLDVLKFMSGIYGPSPMLFASKDGVSAPVVRFRVGDQESDVGPLAVRLHVLFEQVSTRKEALTIKDFVNHMQEPFALTGDGDSRHGAGAVIRAYTALRRDFAEDLPPLVLVRSQGQVRMP
jgi:hypothetical protein